MISELNAKRFVLASMILFMPLPVVHVYDFHVYVYSLPLLVSDLFLHLGDNWLQSTADFGQAILYAALLGYIAKQAVHLVRRCSSTPVRFALLIALVVLPMIVACLPIFYMPIPFVEVLGIPNTLWVDYPRFWEIYKNYDSSLFKSLLIAFTAGSLLAQWWITYRRREIPRLSTEIPGQDREHASRDGFLSQEVATWLVWVAMAAFVPTFVFFGVGASVWPYALLVYGTIRAGVDNIFLFLWILGHFVIYSYLIYLGVRWIVRFVFRFRSPFSRAVLLFVVLCLPIAIGSLPIFFDSGIRGGDPPAANAWVYYGRSCANDGREIVRVFGVLCIGLVARFVFLSTQAYAHFKARSIAVK
jgi:hypothetical protein